MAEARKNSNGIRDIRQLGNHRRGVHQNGFPDAPRNKYHARKVEFDGMTFDSEREARRYAELRLLERRGVIHDLECQVAFELIPAQKDKAGKTVERKCSYIADFVYVDGVGDLHVEDAKGMRTEVYKIKRKLMLFKYGIRIEEV